MRRFYDVVTDQFGNPANGVLVSVYNASTGLPATIYRDSDNALTATNVISNPFTTNASGIAAFAVANGQYTITYSGSSITPRTFTWLTLNDGSVSSVPWGSITGTLSDQTDLNTALGLKAPSASPTFTTSATFSFLTNTLVPFSGAAGALTDNANLTYTVGTGLKVNDSTASTSTTTGALVVTGGLGVGGAFFLAGKLTCSSTADFGTTTATSTTNVRLYGAAGYYKLIQFHSGSSVRWYFGAGNEAESTGDAGSYFRMVACDDSGNNIDDVMNVVRASGGAITLGSTGRSVSIAKTANNAQWIHGSSSELLTLSTAGTTTDTTANLLPANSIIEAVVARVTTTITTATSWQLGDPTTAGRFTNANSTMTAGTTDIGLKHQQGSVATDAAGPVQTAAAKVRVTTVGTPGAGAVRITVFYRQFVAPTS